MAQREFKQPERLHQPNVSDCLNIVNDNDDSGRSPPEDCPLARANVILARRKIVEAGGDPRDNWIIDCDSSPSWMTFLKDRSPCLTRSRSAGYWISSRGRRLTAFETMKIQGINPSNRDICETDSTLRSLTGNAMCVTMVKVFARQLLDCTSVGVEPAGLAAPHGASAPVVGGASGENNDAIVVEQSSVDDLLFSALQAQVNNKVVNRLHKQCIQRLDLSITHSWKT